MGLRDVVALLAERVHASGTACVMVRRDLEVFAHSDRVLRMHDGALGRSVRECLDNGSMPKITAPSVAEHRSQQREALIREATRILLSDGPTAVTPRAVGAAVGLARSSVYEYFPTTGDLLAEVAIRAITEWSTELRAAMGPAEPGWSSLEAYVRSTLAMVAEGKHEIADRLEGVAFSDEQVHRFMEHHDDLSSPLPQIMTDLGAKDPQLAGSLAQGMVDAAVKRVAQGGDVDAVADAVLAALRHGFA